MTQFADESVMAMRTDPQDHYLLMGDTAGLIAVFDIRNYSISTYNNKVAIAAIETYPCCTVCVMIAHAIQSITSYVQCQFNLH